ncbi:MAG: hypothetical protein ISS71_05990 [Phycisphaerae bacterium]|nr:hypothetical protein [Phycisphaerae bacterium]
MAKRRSKQVQKAKEGVKTSSKVAIPVICAFVAGCILCGGLFLLLGSGASQTASGPQTIDQLLNMPEEKLAKVDIGLMNLICAKGLAGSEDLDIEKCLATLDEWAEFIRKDTEARLPSYFNNPAKYDNSVNFFKMVNLVLMLKEDMGISYNLMNMTNPNFADSREVFIHGPLGGGNHGSCTNLPVLCIAVGRRLGYPLKLVPSAEHFFIRWENPAKEDRFNMEVSCEGTDTLPDEHYRNWPRKLNELDEIHGYYLKSLSPEGELAAFLHFRGDILTAAKKPVQAQLAYAQGYSLMPGTMEHLLNLAATVDRELEKLAKKDFESIGTSVKYTVCPTMDEKDLKNAWVYRYPKSEMFNRPTRQNITHRKN